MTSVSRLAVALGLLCALACGGTRDVERPEPSDAASVPLPHESAPPPDCSRGSASSGRLIDDFESGVANFFLFNDGTGSFSYPEPGVFPLPASELETPRCGSRFALNIRVADLVAWGGGFGMSLGVREHGEDWSGYSGISFWGRRSSFSQAGLLAGIAETETNVRGCICKPNEFPPSGEPLPEAYRHCEASPTDRTPPSGREKCDWYRAAAVLGTAWSELRIPFSELRQAGWGKPAQGLDTGRVFELNFAFGAGDWDIWLDDVGVYVD